MITNPAISDSIYQLLKQYNNFMLFVHENPDCDTLGSSFGLMLSLRKLGKQAHIVGLNQKVRNKFKGVFPFDEVALEIPQWDNVAAIILDISNKERILGWKDFPYAFAQTIRFDHHIFVETIAQHEWIDQDASSTCEMIGWFLIHHQMPIDNAIIECLYAGLLTDTGRFCFPSTSASTFSLMNKFMEYDFGRQKILDGIFNKSLFDLKVENKLRKMIRVTPEGAGYIIVPKRISKKIGAINLTDKVWLMAGVNEIKIWCYLYYDQDLNIFKGSLRSRSYDVNQIAKQFNGGGHLLASGFKLNSTKDIPALKAAIKKVLLNE